MRDTYAPHMSVRRIQQVLRDAEFLEYKPRKAAHKLTPLHKENRVNFARRHLLLNKRVWKKVLFKDEKRFTLDGPDRSGHYLADKRVEEHMRLRRHSGGGG